MVFNVKTNNHTSLPCETLFFGVCSYNSLYYFLLRGTDMVIMSQRCHLLLNEGNQEEDLNLVQ